MTTFNDLNSISTTASLSSVDTTSFTGNLGPTDTTVQHALETIDALSSIGDSLKVKNSGTDTGNDYLYSKLRATIGSNVTDAFELSIYNPGGIEQSHFQFDETKVNHENLLNYNPNKHIDHSSLAIVTAANSGLSGGGYLTASKTLAVDIHGTTALGSIDLSDEVLFYSGLSVGNRKITVNNLLASFSPEYTKVKVSATDITSDYLSSKISFSNGSNSTNALESTILNPLGNEQIQAQLDISKINHNSLLNTHNLTTNIDHNTINNHHNLTTDIDHNGLNNYVANQHINHTTVSISTNVDSGLSGGGDLSSTRSLAVDIHGTTAATSNADLDEILIYQISSGERRRMTRANFLLGVTSVDEKVKADATDSTSGYLDAKLTVSSGTNTSDPLELSTINVGGAHHRNIQIDASKISGVPFYSTIGATIDGGGSVITTGFKSFLYVPYACTIVDWTILADVSGSCVIDIWKNAYASFPPTVADTITGSEKPTLSTQQKNQDTNLTTWTTAINAGDVLAFNVDSASTVTKINLVLKIQRIT